MAEASGDRAPSDLDGAPTIAINIDSRSILTVGACAIAALAVFAIAESSPTMTTRVAIGIVLGVALNPIASSVERRWNCSRRIATAVVGGALVLLFTTVVLLLAPPAVNQAREFSRQLPATIRSMYSWPLVGHRLRDGDAAGAIDRWIADLPTKLDSQTLGDLAGRILGGVASGIIVVVTALAVLLDGPTLVGRVRGMIPAARRERADRTGRILYHTIGNYFAGSLLVAALNGLVVLTTGLALGVPLAPVAALWSTLTNLIPQVGGFLGGSFFVLLALTKGPVTGLIALVVFFGYQQIENHLVQPAVVGRAVNLSPPVTMLAALVGGAAAGIPGALLATPLLGAAKALYLESRGTPAAPRRRSIIEQLGARLRRFRSAR